MIVYLVHVPQGVEVVAPMHADDAQGEHRAVITPGHDFFGWSYLDLLLLGEGRHTIDTR